MPVGHYAKRAYRVELLLSLGAAVGDRAARVHQEDAEDSTGLDDDSTHPARLIQAPRKVFSSSSRVFG
jgi:hypothetical protein